MEEKKEKKTITISLSTGVALIIIIMISVVVLSMTYFYKLNEMKRNNQNQSEDTQVANVTPMQDVTPTESVTPTEEVHVTEEAKPTEEKSVNFTDEQVKTSFKKYLDLLATANTSPTKFLESLDYNKVMVKDDVSFGEIKYTNTRIKYSDFKDKVHEYISEEVFLKRINTAFGVECFKNIDDLLYVANVGAGGIQFEIENFENKGNNTYLAKYYLLDSEDEGKTVEFTVTNNDGLCIINSISE